MKIEVDNPSYSEQEKISIPYMVEDNKRKVRILKDMLESIPE